MTKKDLISFDALKDQALGSRPTAAETDEFYARFGPPRPWPPTRRMEYLATPQEVDAVASAVLRSKVEMMDFGPIEAKITRAYVGDRLSDRLKRRLLRWKRWWLFQCSICGSPKTRWKAGDRHTHGPYCRRCNKTLAFGGLYGAGPAGLRRMIER